MPATSPEALGASPYWKSYTLAGADIDLVAEGGGPCRYIRMVSLGNLNLQRAQGGTNVSEVVALGELVGGQTAKVLTSGSTGGIKFEVYW